MFVNCICRLQIYILGVKKVRRYYLNRHWKANDATIFAKHHKCDIGSNTKNLQHVNYSLISKWRILNCWGHTLSRGWHRWRQSFDLHWVWHLKSLLFFKLVKIIKMQKHWYCREYFYVFLLVYKKIRWSTMEFLSKLKGHPFSKLLILGGRDRICIGRLRKSGGQKINLISLFLNKFSWNFA